MPRRGKALLAGSSHQQPSDGGRPGSGTNSSEEQTTDGACARKRKRVEGEISQLDARAREEVSNDFKCLNLVINGFVKRRQAAEVKRYRTQVSEIGVRLILMSLHLQME